MESNGTSHQDCKTNPAFHYTNGAMSMSESNKNLNNNGVHKPRKFSLPTGNSYPAKAPLDRMASVASSQFTTANSVLRLVSDDRVDGHTKPKTWFAFCKRKWPWILLYFSVVGIIVALTTMYVLEKRNNDFTAVSSIWILDSTFYQQKWFLFFSPLWSRFSVNWKMERIESID